MVWVILFIPVCIWLSVSVVSQLNMLSLGGVTLTCAIFFLIEFKQVSRDSSRDRKILWVMCLMLVTMAAGSFI
ncbi:MAG TPA: hypothetical protein PLM29_14460 [Deltaproteobacteria bacterium]|nr:hypothetical protein [Deltaproteobacteria bacterium]